MADDTTKTIRIVVDASRAVDGSRQATRALEQIDRSTSTMAETMDRAMGSLRRLGGLLAASFGARAILEAADAFTKFNNALQVAGVTTGDLATVQSRLFAAANRNGVEIGALSQLYSRAAMAGSELGASQSKLLQFVDGVTAALRLQGGSTEQASGALLQLSQSLGSGIVRAEEFNSILEGAFPIAQAAARGIDGMGGSVAKLRAAIADGHVTSAVFFNGLLKGFGETEKAAANMNLTVGSSLTVLHNGFIRAVGSADQFVGASAGLASAIALVGRGLDALGAGMDHLRDQLPQIAEGAATAGTALAIAFAPTAMAAMTAGFVALGRAGVTAIGAITAAIAANPIGAIAVAITAAVSAIWYFRDEIQQVLGVDVADVAKKGANFIIGSFVVAYHEIEFVWKNLGTAIGAAVTGGMNAAVRAINDLIQGAADKVDWLIEKTNRINPFSPIPKIGALTPIREFENPGSAQLDAALKDRSARIRQDMTKDYIGAFGELFRPAYGPPVPGAIPPAGGAAPVQSKSAQADAEKLQKLVDGLKSAAEAQDAMTAAARRGDVAFQEQQAHADAVAKAIDFFGGKVDAANPKVVALTEVLEKYILRTKEGAAAQSFVVATTELDKQNDLLKAQIALMNEAPDIQARELAIIKSKQEAQKAGNALTADDIEARRQAIEQNETLKLQAEQMKAANELWTEPLKQGLRDIQTAGADAWERILETGDFTFKSLGDVFTKTLRRMAAEFLALATIRPVMSLAVEVIGPSGLGILGGNSVAQLGFSGGSNGGGLGLGGGGLGSIFSSGGSSGTGWLARQFSGISDFLASPVSGLFSGTPAGGFSNVGDLISSGQTLASSSAGGSLLGGLSVGSALGGALSIGSGAFGLIRGGQSAAGTIGSIGQIVGGGLMLVPGLQPVGAAVSLLSSILPGLFGDGPKIPPQPALAYGAGAFAPTAAGGYAYSGDSLGSGSSMQAGAETLANSLTKAFRAAGLSIVPGSLIGGTIASGTDHTLQGGQWQNRPYTQTGLILPGGGYERLTYNDSSRDLDAASQYLIAQAFKANVLHGGVSGAGEGLKAGLQKIDPVTSEDLDRVVSLGTAYDNLGKAINPAKDAIDKISASFDELKSFATEAGLSLDPVNAELAKQTKRSAQDFIDAMLDPLAVQMRALEDERASALESAQYIRDNVEGVFVDLDKITAYYGQKRLALEDQFYQGGISNLQQLINKLTYGDLSNGSPTTLFAGARAQFDTAYRGALGGDASSIANLAGYGDTLATLGRQMFASGPEYEALRREIIDLSAKALAANGGGASTPSGTVSAETQANSQQLVQLTNLVTEVTRQNQDLQAQNRTLNDQLNRLLSKLATA